MTSNRFVYVIAFGTLLCFGGLGLLGRAVFLDLTFPSIVESNYSLVLQILFGVLIGAATGAIALVATSFKLIRKSAQKYTDFLSRLNLTWVNIILISLCAGFGEELFFRAFVQHYLGIWLTSVIFVALHGYLNPKDLGISLYGVLVVFIIAGYGYLYQEVGYIAAAIAHAVFDVILLGKLRFESRNKSNIVEETNSIDYEEGPV